MTKKFFPSFCFDNFYSDPDAVRKIALSHEFSKPDDGRFPGKRTQPIHLIAPDLFNFFTKRLFSLFYDFDQTSVRWQLNSEFQLIEPYSNDPKLNESWIHSDNNTMLAGVIYLTPNANLDCGTSIFSLNPGEVYSIDQDEKVEFYKNPTIPFDQQEKYINALEANNSKFTETVHFKNVYNRLVAYDGSDYHKANSFFTGTEPRLTQTFFLQTINSAPPLIRANNA